LKAEIAEEMETAREQYKKCGQGSRVFKDFRYRTIKSWSSERRVVGKMENRIKEQQLYLFSDRTSTHWMRSNQLRLYFASFAYVLVETLRRIALCGTEMSNSQCHTIREKLFKIGAQIRLTVRKVWLSLSESYPFAYLLEQIWTNLQKTPLRI
jgi:hypothetical protein